MIWIILLVILLAIAFILYRGSKRVMMNIKAAKLGQKGAFSQNTWQRIPFDTASFPIRMAFSEVAGKSAYQSSFKVMFDRFVNVALSADDTLNPDAVSVISRQLYSDLSLGNLVNIEPPTDSKIAKDFYMVQSAVLFALICTQDKGANIKHRLMESKNNQAGGDIYTQQKADREYFEFMNNHYSIFCQMASILEPRKSVLIETVAGYLLTD